MMSIDRIAPYHLKTLLAIARLGSFQAAADRLNTAQPAISARVRELEGQLGTALFQREGRRMILTARGRQLVIESEPVLAEFDRLLMRIADRSSVSGLARIGTGEIAAASCMPSLVAKAQAAFPRVTLEIEVDLTARMLDHLLAGSSDLVFLAGPVDHPAIVTAPIGSLDLVWLASPAVANTAADPPPAIWSLPAHSPLHHITRQSLAARGLDGRSFSSCNNVRTLIDIVVRGGGIGLFPETMVRAEMAAGQLVEIAERPARRIEFQAAIRQRETDAVILALFELARDLTLIDPEGGPDAGGVGRSGG